MHLPVGGAAAPGDIAREARRQRVMWCLGGGLPSLAIGVLLWADVFDLGDMVLGQARRESVALAAATAHHVISAAAEAAWSAAQVPAPAPVPAERPKRVTPEGIPVACQVMGTGYEVRAGGDACAPEAAILDAAECREAAASLGLRGDWADAAHGGSEPSAPGTCTSYVDALAAAAARPLCRKVALLPSFLAALRSSGEPLLGNFRARWKAWTEGSSNESGVRTPRLPAIGASIAVHPPKFYAAANFLRQWAACPEARRALAVFLVFIKAEDHQLFLRAQECANPDIPHELWTPVVVEAPERGWPTTGGSGHQVIAAYKKWYGVAHMMDLPDDVAPSYGLLLDAELAMFHTYGSDMVWKSDAAAASLASGACAEGGVWSRLRSRVEAMDASKSFPAARVSRTLAVYDFGNMKMSGNDYDRELIRSCANFAFGKEERSVVCDSPGCEEVKRQVQDSLFSWWTDLPWARLETARRMFERLSAPRTAASIGGWRKLARGLRFPPFEYMAYQQYCVLHEGYHFRDVTNITGEAKWGSYLEDPQPGARLDELTPLWLSGEAMLAASKGQVSLSKDTPPLLIFHADHSGNWVVPGLYAEKELWQVLVLDLLAAQGRPGEFDKDSIQL